MTYTKEEMDDANKTAKKSINRNAVTYRWIKKNIDKDKSILDYGAGPNAQYIQMLEKQGFFDAYAWEFGNNFNPMYHLSNALNYTYDVVYLSNVLNIQTNLNMFYQTLNESISCVKSDGIYVTNLPYSPRETLKCNGWWNISINHDILYVLLCDRFNNVATSEKFPSIFICKSIKIPSNKPAI